MLSSSFDNSVFLITKETRFRFSILGLLSSTLTHGEWGEPSLDPCPRLLYPAPQQPQRHRQLRIIQLIHPSSSNPACQLVLGNPTGLEMHNSLQSGQTHGRCPHGHWNQAQGVHGAQASRHGLDREHGLQMGMFSWPPRLLALWRGRNQNRIPLSLEPRTGCLLPWPKGTPTVASPQNLLNPQPQGLSHEGDSSSQLLPQTKGLYTSSLPFSFFSVTPPLSQPSP